MASYQIKLSLSDSWQFILCFNYSWGREQLKRFLNGSDLARPAIKFYFEPGGF